MDRAVPDRLGNNTAFYRPSNYPYRINDLRLGKDTIMRKPRDYDAELKALEDKARELKAAQALYDELDQINGYTSQYHHGENMADATPDQIDPTELTGFTRRTLRIVNALQA